MARMIRKPELLSLSHPIGHGQENDDLYRLTTLMEHLAEDEDTYDELQLEFESKASAYDARVDSDMINNLMQRLNKGWNRSLSRRCKTCNYFVSTKSKYWTSKDNTYCYALNSPFAKLWRRGPCFCGGGPDGSLIVGNAARAWAVQWCMNQVDVCPGCQVKSWGDGIDCCCSECHFSCSCCH